MRLFAGAFLLLVGLGEPGAQESDELVLTRANLIDARGDTSVDDVSIRIKDGRITEIGRELSVAPETRVIDLRGKYIVAGLIDVHCHLDTLAGAKAALRSGITTARVMGVSYFADVGLRELRKTDAIEAPEILAAGYHLGPGPSRGPGDEPPEGLFFGAPEVADLIDGIRGVDNYRRVTRVNLERDVDWIKITATARAGLPETDPRRQLMTRDEIGAVVEEAGRQGVSVAAHAHGDEGARAAVEAGVRSIEHGTYLAEETLQLMRAQGTYFVPTLAVVVDLTEPGGNYDHPFLRVRGRHMLPRVEQSVRIAYRLGVPIATGTDTGFGLENTIRIQNEIEQLVHAGMTPRDAIGSATFVGAELLGISHRTGSVRVGLEADLLVVEGNPLKDVRVLQDVLMVVSDGRVVVDRVDFAIANR